MKCSLCGSKYHRASSCPKRTSARLDLMAAILAASAITIGALWQSLNAAANAVALFARM